ncbi:MAG: restriction endonuclease subunit S [Crocinitomicaceae bacterium]|nr:restriction endonuclease subunit S [Crocinitomicaceae bacterium]
MREDWDKKTLGELGKVCMCKRIMKHQTSTEGDIPFYKIGTFGKSPNAYIDNETYLSFKEKYSFPKVGDILISAAGTIGRRVIYDGEPAYFQDSNIVWIDNNKDLVSNDYLYHFYGFCNWNPSKGATISRLYHADLRRIEIPIPPISEQKEIVSILDDAFASIDKAKANIERNIENAKDLFQSQKETYIQLLSKDLSLTPITDVCEKIFAGGDKPKDYFSKTKTDECQIPIISNGAKNDGLYGFTKTPKVTKSSITVSARGTIGYTVFRNYPFVPIVRLIVLTPKDDIIAPEYLMRVLQSLDILRTGSSIPQLTVPMIKTYSIPVPSIEKQTELVASLNQLEKLTKSSISMYEKELENLEELKKSILQKAFSGELVKEETYEKI